MQSSSCYPGGEGGAATPLADIRMLRSTHGLGKQNKSMVHVDAQKTVLLKTNPSVQPLRSTAARDADAVCLEIYIIYFFIFEV